MQPDPLDLDDPHHRPFYLILFLMYAILHDIFLVPLFVVLFLFCVAVLTFDLLPRHHSPGRKIINIPKDYDALLLDNTLFDLINGGPRFSRRQKRNVSHYFNFTISESRSIA